MPEHEEDPLPPEKVAIDAVLVLAGGASRRLGRAKAWLDWDGETLLARVTRRLTPLADHVVVAARPGQRLPHGPWTLVEDALPGAGPLAGLAAGLGRIAEEDRAARVAVAACDYPFADPTLFRALAGHDAAVVLPRHAGHLHPLQAVWRARLGTACAAALGRGDRRVRSVVDTAGGTVVEAAAIPGVDPARALLNVNDPGTLARARALDAGD